MIWPIKIFEIIKFVTSAINENATIILAIITGVYAYFTYRMATIMKKQVIADIEVTNMVLGSNFSESWFLKRLKDQPESINKDSRFSFKLLFDVRNRNSGSGSIDKPILELKFSNDDFEYNLFPDTKEVEYKNINANTQQEVVTDLGGTIFLRGGESQKIELKYNLYNFGDDLSRHIKENLSSVEYYLKYKNNLATNHRLKVDDIRSEREVYRK